MKKKKERKKFLEGSNRRKRSTIKSIINEGGRSQNLILFIQGKPISGDSNIRGINQFPNPPIKNGITTKKIIKNACLVTIVTCRSDHS